MFFLLIQMISLDSCYLRSLEYCVKQCKAKSTVQYLISGDGEFGASKSQHPHLHLLAGLV